MATQNTLKNFIFSNIFPTLPARWKYLSKNYRYLMSLKDIHKNRRAFIIGSGPSLKIRDLNRLHNEITFSCNKIYLAFNDTRWRPTYYSVIDSMVAENCSEEIQQLKLTKIFSSVVKPCFANQSDIIWLRDLPSPIVDNRRQFQFSKNIADGTYGGFTVLYTMLQLAYYMGITEVYIIGLDFSFTTPRPSDEKSRLGETLLRCEGEVNHFHPDYRKKGERWTMPQMEYQYLAFQKAKEEFQNAGRQIFNASRTTKLDILPLIDLDEVLKNA